MEVASFQYAQLARYQVFENPISTVGNRSVDNAAGNAIGVSRRAGHPGESGGG